MRNWMLALCAAAGLVAGCGSRSPISFCNDFQVEACARVYECYDAQTKATTQFVQQFGASQAECESKLKSTNCATVTNDNACPGATKYHSDKADSCLSDLKAASCQTITAGSFASGNCDAVCS